MAKKYALILSGGAFKGAFQLGAINKLNNRWQELTGGNNMHFDIVAGVSVGALNGILVAQNNLKDLNNLWAGVKKNGPSEIYTSDFLSFVGDDFKLKPDFVRIIDFLWSGMGLELWRFKRVVQENLQSIKSIGDNSPLNMKIQKYVNPSSIPESTSFHCGMVSLDTGTYNFLSHKDLLGPHDDINNLCNAILASTIMPIIWEPVPIVYNYGNNTKLTNLMDGGLRNVSPMGDIIDMIRGDEFNEWTLIVINCSSESISNNTDQDWSFGRIVERSFIEIMVAEIISNDIGGYKRIHDLLEIMDKSGIPHPGYKRFETIVVNPDKNVLLTELDCSPGITQDRIDHGVLKMDKAITDFLIKRGNGDLRSLTIV